MAIRRRVSTAVDAAAAAADDDDDGDAPCSLGDGCNSDSKDTQPSGPSPTMIIYIRTTVTFYGATAYCCTA